MRAPITLVSFIWQLIKPYKLQLTILLLVAVVWATEYAISPYLFKVIVNRVTEAGNNNQLLLQTVVTPAILYGFMSVIMNLTWRSYEWACLILYPAIKAQVVRITCAYTAGHSYSFFQQNFSGSIVKKIYKLPESVEPIVQMVFEFIVPRILMLFVSSAILATAQPVFSVLLFCWIILFVVLSYLFARKAAQYAEDFSRTITILDGKISDQIINVITTKIFAQQNYEQQLVDQTLTAVTAADRKMQLYNLKSRFFLGLVVSILMFCMIGLLIYERMHDRVTVGDFVLVLTVVSWVMWQVWESGQRIVTFTKNLGDFFESITLLNLMHEVEDLPQADPLTVTSGLIEFRAVNFGYLKSSNVFTNLSVTIPAGQKVGLVGFSGGGKSTFVKLILRLFDLQSGEILIDNQDIKTVTQYSLRQQLAMIPQDPELFHRTIMENIRYGRLDATDDEVVAAAKAAHCHEFIRQLPLGYNSLVGERGVKLSGGQRQRIAIARVILKQSKILILDEATSALDSVTEKYVQESLHQLFKNKTVIVVAHRLATLQEMDRILFFSDGQIIEDGSLQQLIAAQGAFAKLWQMQRGGFLLDEGDSVTK